MHLISSCSPNPTKMILGQTHSQTTQFIKVKKGTPPDFTPNPTLGLAYISSSGKKAKEWDTRIEREDFYFLFYTFCTSWIF